MKYEDFKDTLLELTDSIYGYCLERDNNKDEYVLKVYDVRRKEKNVIIDVKTYWRYFINITDYSSYNEKNFKLNITMKEIDSYKNIDDFFDKHFLNNK